MDLSSKLKTFRYDFFQKSTQSDEMNQNTQRFKYNKGCIKMIQPFLIRTEETKVFHYAAYPPVWIPENLFPEAI